MLDIIEMAREKGLKEGKDIGMEEGKEIGLKEGKEESVKEMVVEALIERFELVPARMSEQIRGVQSPDVLRGLFRKAVRCGSLEEFGVFLEKAA